MKKLDIHFFILIFIISSVCIADTAIYIIKLQYIYAILFGFIITAIVFSMLKLKNKISFENNFNKYDFIFLGFLFLYFIFTIGIPDNSWDTLSYHIYLQENPFIDKINYDFFAGRAVNSFLFPLADRINYLFRSILGFRLGTIFSYYILIVMFYQIKRFLLKLTNRKNDILISIISILPLTMSIILQWVGTYYIDNYSLCILLEIFYIAFFEKAILKDRIKLYMYAYFIGIAVTLKVSNIVLLIPLAIYFIIKNRKEFTISKWKQYILAGIIFTIPFIIYAIYNIIETGNPVFPYYNSIFKSRYFAIQNWKDTNFGCNNILELFIWPIIAVLDGKRAYDSNLIDIMWAIGYIIIITILILRIRKKKYDTISKIITIVLLTDVLWAKILLGYVRYATILLTLTNIIILSEIINTYKKRNKIILAIVIMISTLYSIALTTAIKFDKIYNFLASYVGLEKRQEYSYFENLFMILKDRENYKIDIDGVWGAIRDDSMYPTLIRNKVPIYNLEDWIATNDITKNMYLDKMKKSKIYVPCSYNLLESKIEYLYLNGFKILPYAKMYDNISFMNKGDKLLLLQVEYIGEISEKEKYEYESFMEKLVEQIGNT